MGEDLETTTTTILQLLPCIDRYCAGMLPFPFEDGHLLAVIRLGLILLVFQRRQSCPLKGEKKKKGGGVNSIIPPYFPSSTHTPSHPLLLTLMPTLAESYHHSPWREQ